MIPSVASSMLPPSCGATEAEENLLKMELLLWDPRHTFPFLKPIDHLKIE
jgi:hypothetical protein